MQRNLIRSFGVLPASQRIIVNVAKLHKNATDTADRRTRQPRVLGKTLPCSAMLGAPAEIEPPAGVSIRQTAGVAARGGPTRVSAAIVFSDR
jgi:hypothetical protein